MMHARFERIHAVGPLEMEVLGLLSAKEAFNCRVVKAVAFAAHALLDFASREHRTLGSHHVVPAPVGVHDQVGDATGPRKRCFKHAGNKLEDWAPCHAIRDDLAAVHCPCKPTRKLLAIHIERSDIGCPLLV